MVLYSFSRFLIQKYVKCRQNVNPKIPPKKNHLIEFCLPFKCNTHRWDKVCYTQMGQGVIHTDGTRCIVEFQHVWRTRTCFSTVTVYCDFAHFELLAEVFALVVYWKIVSTNCIQIPKSYLSIHWAFTQRNTNNNLPPHSGTTKACSANHSHMHTHTHTHTLSHIFCTRIFITVTYKGYT